MNFDNLIDVAGLENIATQINDPVTVEVIKRFEKIKDLLIQHNIGTSKVAFSRASISKLFSEIDDIISKRFGMNFKHISSTGGMTYGVYTTSSTVSNAISPYKEEILKNTEAYLNKCEKLGTCNTSKKQQDIKDNDEDWGSVLKNLLENSRKINDMINTKGIQIDFQNARVKNFPKHITVFIIVDIAGMFRDFDITPEEITAFLFHEIGHQFTHLSESYRSIANVTTLIDTLHNEYNETKDIRESIVITTKKLSNKEIDENNTTQVFTELTNVVVKYINDDDVYSYTDSEALADQFSTRFGLGVHITTGLDKLNMKIEDLFGSPTTQLLTVIFVLFLQSFLMVLLFIPGSLLSLAIIALLMSVSIVVLTMLISGSDAKKQTYDDNTHRIKRIKFDMVRQLRETDLPKEVKKRLLKDIERVEKVLSKYPNSKYLIERIGDIMPWNIDSFTLTRLSKELEELSENDLVLAKNKLQQFL